MRGCATYLLPETERETAAGQLARWSAMQKNPDRYSGCTAWSSPRGTPLRAGATPSATLRKRVGRPLHPYLLWAVSSALVS